MGPPLSCEHGSLRRSCEVCERDDRIRQLEAELEAARGGNTVALAAMTEYQKGILSLRTELEMAKEALRRLHDEACMDKFGNRLDMGPMYEPSEAAVLLARKALEGMGGR